MYWMNELAKYIKINDSPDVSLTVGYSSMVIIMQ